MKAKPILLDDNAQRVFEELRKEVPADVQEAMGGTAAFERVLKVLTGFVERQESRRDTVWDRDARAFTQHWTRSEKPEQAARFGAETADALASERARRRN